MTGAETLTVVALHGLGLSSAYFAPVRDRLASHDLHLRALDLPGFGASPALTPTPDMVGALTDHVVAWIAAQVSGPWVLLGHSMGGKIASCVAARSLRGTDPIFGLMGIVLLAPSPPTPEPMDDERRELMLSWVADGPIDAADAHTFVTQNVGAPLPADLDQATRQEVQHCSPEAWRQWLTVGADQDVSDDVGRLALPALILGGSADEDLGAAAQPGLHAGVYPRARFETVAGAGHLLAVERPDVVATAVGRFVDEQVRRTPLVPPEWTALIASERTIPAVRRVLAERALPDDPDYAPEVLSPRQLQVLRILADFVVPQSGPCIDLAARVDAQLARGEGDGWRPDGQPPDPDAYRIALDLCAGIVDLDHDGQRTFVADLVDGEAHCGSAGFGDASLTSWFEDARVDLTRQWVGHPATLARIGFDGFATGSLDVAARGFVQLAIGRREAWEPAGLGSTS